jgi:AmmeMemoRadiSam system protein A
MLSREERQSLLTLARDTIRARLERKSLPVLEPIRGALGEPRGAFVTVHKKGKLRGCIGYLEAVKPLNRTVQEMAIAAAFQDPRFPPLVQAEFDEIDIEISVMSPIRKIGAPDDIRVGTHGIIVKRGYNQGLLLPQVATEQAWDRDTLLEHTCYKAGLPGDCWKKPDTEIFVFSAEVFSERES